MKSILIYFLLFVISDFVLAYDGLQLKGMVTDEYNHSLMGVAVQLEGRNIGTTTNRKGSFVLTNLLKDKYTLKVTFMGYQTYVDTILLDGEKELRIQLKPSIQLLNELEVLEQQSNNTKKEYSLDIKNVDRKFLAENSGGSLMQVLARLPGISSMDIGSGQSKPMIRGMGFNRVLVAENGVKHEAQEWGVDHGLEIDQFSVERVEVIKGPYSLMYGANAIGGVIDFKQIVTPEKHTQGGSAMFSTQTNNNLYAASAKYFVRKENLYVKAHVSMSEYADYKVPTDSIEYMSYYFKLNNNRLRNTAGNEKSGGLSLGYLLPNFSSHLSITDVFSRSGFFANAHGLEIRNSFIPYDTSVRDIDLPSQQVNHFKILSNSIWMIKDYKLNIDVAFQNNYRQEFSEAVSHGYMPLPADSLERLYNKDTWNGNFRLEMPKHGISSLALGLNAEYQQNRIGGWGFILPAYRSSTSGIFLHDKIRFSEQWILNAGIRYDIGYLSVDAYNDWYATPTGDGNTAYKQRAMQIHRIFNSLSWGIGGSFSHNDFVTKLNVGKSFRMPTAKELASNGINYHMYRYEKGDATLDAEESYQLDMTVHWKVNALSIEVSPFVNYFPNYIYLNPTSDYYEAQQVYYHSQSEVFRTGGECVITYDITTQLLAGIDVEYVYSEQLSGAKKGFTLPFSPPLVSNLLLNYRVGNVGKFQNPTFGINYQVVAAQNSIVPPEKKTPGYGLLNLFAGTTLTLGKQLWQMNVNVHNVLNTKYFDHTSFYRLIEVPGQGRNVGLNLRLAF